MYFQHANSWDNVYCSIQRNTSSFRAGGSRAAYRPFYCCNYRWDVTTSESESTLALLHEERYSKPTFWSCVRSENFRGSTTFYMVTSTSNPPLSSDILVTSLSSSVFNARGALRGPETRRRALCQHGPCVSPQL